MSATRSYDRPVPEYADVPAKVVRQLRKICLALPDAYEEEAWTGTRWLVRRRTFAHVLTVEADDRAAHARVVGSDRTDHPRDVPLAG